MHNIHLLGCGKTTKAIAKRFGVNRIFDDREIADSLCLHSKEFPKEIGKDDILVPAPAIPPYNPIVKKFADSVISEYDLFYKMGEFPFSIWISGTNGKTTTTAMIAHLLEDRGIDVGGNIGKPLGSMDTTAPIWILETSSFTLHYTKHAKPNIYILLPITPDHINWHSSFEEYEKSKLKPIANLREGEVAIVPEKYRDIPTNGYTIPYRDITSLANFFEFDISKIRFSGGFLLDSLLALAVSKILFDEVDYEKLNRFTPSPHRQEKILDSRGRVWINDSKATNPDSTIAMLESLERERAIYLILGGEDKGADWDLLFQKIAEMNIKIFGIGKSLDKSRELAKRYGIEIVPSETLYQAVQDISKIHNSESIAILSPASASFDQFSSYEERGDQFRKFVKGL